MTSETDWRYLELFSTLVEQGKTVLDAGCGDGIPVDDYLIRQGFAVNGIDAMKDTPGPERSIGIRTSREEDFAELSVSDRGTGIPLEKLKEVFEPLFITKAEGMGMGLSIARTIVEAHNGHICAENRDGGGASFRVRLPLVR